MRKKNESELKKKEKKEGGKRRRAQRRERDRVKIETIQRKKVIRRKIEIKK